MKELNGDDKEEKLLGESEENKLWRKKKKGVGPKAEIMKKRGVNPTSENYGPWGRNLKEEKK